MTHTKIPNDNDQAAVESDGWHDFTLEQAQEFLAAMRQQHKGRWTGLGRIAEQMTAECAKLRAEVERLTGQLDLSETMRRNAVREAERERDEALDRCARWQSRAQDDKFALEKLGRENYRAVAEVERLNPLIIVQIRLVARENGWAIGVHGSMARDIDLIAVPWTGEACDAETLVRAIANATGYAAVGGGLGKPRPGGRRSVLLKHPDAIRLDPPDAKGHWDPMVVDLSLMPSDALLAGHPAPVKPVDAAVSAFVAAQRAQGVEVER